MYLLIGPPGAGKTLLLKRLQTYSPKGLDDKTLAPATIPTIGTNLTTVTLGRRDDLTIREMGGAMGPIWHSYYKDTTAIIYVVDAANRFQVSAACIQLLMVLSHAHTQNLPVLLLLNKSDMPTVMSRGELNSLFRLDDIVHNSPQKVAVLETSAKFGFGLHSVTKWILQNYKAPPVTAVV